MTSKWLSKERNAVKERSNDGSVLVLALMLILLLTLTGLWSTQTNTVNTRISSNENLYNVAFYEADGGSEMAAGLIENTIWERGFCTTSEDESNAVHAYGSLAIICRSDDTFFINTSLSYPAAYFPRSVPRSVACDPVNAGDNVSNFTGFYITGNPELSSGGAIQMISGYEGKGKGSVGGGAFITYDVRSHHRNLQNKSEAVVEIRWRHVL
jgi:hypothetical protein